jgi:hypothetical protein
MKKSIFSSVLLVVLLMATSAKAQMGIGTATPNAAAQLDVTSTTKGFLAPRMTKTERDAITTVSSASKGLLIYQTDNTPGFYYYDGTAWTSLAGSSSAAGVDLTTAQSVGGKKTFTSVDGLLATGTFGTGAASSLGSGTRMMWYPKKAAFRAGYIDGTQWDDANIGNKSFAIGQNTTASGEYSTSMGYATIASGILSTTMGYVTTASGSHSVAMGDNTTASGDNSTTMGSSSIASGNNSIAMGGFSRAVGGNSTAMGYNTRANSFASTTMGIGTRSSGEASIAMGNSTTAMSFAETVIGTFNTDYTATSTSSFNATDRLFVIGNGISGALSNALVMLKNGNTTFGGSLAVNGNGTGTSYTFPTTRGTANQVLTTNGSGGTSWAAPASTGVDLSTNQSVGGLKTFNSNDGLLATGTYGSGTVSSLGNGVRMMWYPRKAAFRAGFVTGTVGDDANIGAYSIAMGLETTASGIASTAMGNFTTASGNNSTAIGADAQAIGAISTAMGNQTKAEGTASTAMGNSTTAIGANSTAMGVGTIANENASTAMGNTTTASGPNSTAMGVGTIASENSSTAMGNTTTASGLFSTAMGLETIASENASTAMGNTTTASGQSSTAMGHGTLALSYAETVIGTYNTNYTPTSTSSFTSTDRLFVIGNGTNTARRNALVMLKNGNTTFSGTVTGVSFTSTSDKRLKKNIVPLKNSIETIMKLKPVSYEKKNSLSSSDYSVKENGFIAQELQKVMPTLVLEGTDKDKLLSVNYTAIIPVLTKAIQEQQKAIQDQHANIKSLEKTAEEQQKQIVELKKMLELLMKK